MRFSLKWALAAMAYVALAAAALSQRSPVWAGLLWTATIFAFCYALLVCFAWDDRRAAALGFVVVSIVYYVHQQMAPTQALPRQILVAAGLDTWQVPNTFEIYVTQGAPANNKQPGEVVQQGEIVAEVVDDPIGAANPKPVKVRRTVMERAFATTRLQAVSAIGFMAAGLTGALLGVLAFRRGRQNG